MKAAAPSVSPFLFTINPLTIMMNHHPMETDSSREHLGTQSSNGFAASDAEERAASERRPYLFYTHWYLDAAQCLDESEMGQFLLVIARYAASRQLPDEQVKPVVRAMFSLIRNVIDSDIKKYDDMVERNRERGRLSAEKRRQNARKTARTETPEKQHDAEIEPIHDTRDTVHVTRDTSRMKRDAVAENGRKKKEEGAGGDREGKAPLQLPPLEKAPLQLPPVGGGLDAAGAAAGSVCAVTSRGELSAAGSDCAAGADAPSRGAVSAAGSACAAGADVPSRGAVAAYWRERVMRSDWSGFYDYYAARNWRDGHGRAIADWTVAAQYWEDRFRRVVVPLRRSAAVAAAEVQQNEHKRLRQKRDAEARQQREAEEREWKAQNVEQAAAAVTPAQARHMLDQALGITGGNEEEAFVLLRRAKYDRTLYARLLEGWT